MPRTKAKKQKRGKTAENVKPNKAELQEEMITDFIKKLEDDVTKKYNEFDMEHLMFKFGTGLDQIMAEVPSAILEKTSDELKLEEEKAHHETAMFKSFAGNATRSVLKNPTFHIDPATEARSRRRSKSQMSIKKGKIGRTSRSLSRTKLQHALTASNNFLTPTYRNVLPATGTITPKMKANTPSVILRRPRQGELAVSMQGSPLMVSSIATDQTANVNIPLLDGRIVSIQPNRGIRTSELPVLDTETLSQIEALRDNLIKVCDMR